MNATYHLNKSGISKNILKKAVTFFKQLSITESLCYVFDLFSSAVEFTETRVRWEPVARFGESGVVCSASP